MGFFSISVSCCEALPLSHCRNMNGKRRRMRSPYPKELDWRMRPTKAAQQKLEKIVLFRVWGRHLKSLQPLYFRWAWIQSDRRSGFSRFYAQGLHEVRKDGGYRFLLAQKKLPKIWQTTRYIPKIWQTKRYPKFGKQNVVQNLAKQMLPVTQNLAKKRYPKFGKQKCYPKFGKKKLPKFWQKTCYPKFGKKHVTQNLAKKRSPKFGKNILPKIWQIKRYPKFGQKKLYTRNLAKTVYTQNLATTCYQNLWVY